MEKQSQWGHSFIQIVLVAVIIFTLIFFGQQGNAATNPPSSLMQSQSEDEPIFTDVPIDHWARQYIEALYLDGYIAGCSSEPLMYCPDERIKRCESAVFIERGIHGEAYLPPDYEEQVFADVALDEWYSKWVNGLWDDGYTAGCGVDPLIYCPLKLHTIAEGSVFFLRMLYGSDYIPPDPKGIFEDAPVDLWYTRWVEDAYEAGILLPCQEAPSLRACPEDPLYRDLAAYMMYQAKGLGNLDPTPTPSLSPPTPTPTPLPPTATPSGSVYYVSINGNDTNAGTSQSQPWRTIQKAIDEATAGDMIRIMEGTYYESIILRNSGSSSEPITLMSYSNEKVVIDGGDNPAIRNTGNVEYWTIQGLTIKSKNRYTIRLGWWFDSETAHFIIRENNIFGSVFTIGSYHLFENNDVDGTGYDGQYGDAGLSDANYSHNIIYRDNYVHDFSNYNGRGIWSQGYTHDNIIEGNTVVNINGSGLGQCIDLDGAGTVEWRHVVRDNYVENCSYVGIQLENVFDSVIENNIIKDGVYAGVIVINYPAEYGCGVGGESNQYGDTNGDNSCRGDPTENIIRQNLITQTGGWGWGYGGIVNWGAGKLYILGNTIRASYGSGNGGIHFAEPAVNVSGGVIQSNIIYQGDGLAICAEEFSDSGYEAFSLDDHNLIFNDNSEFVYGSGTSCSSTYSLSSYQSIVGKGEGSIQANPLLTVDFQLQPNSPAIDTGIDIGLLFDLQGNLRPMGEGFDIGVYEYQ